MRLLPCGDRAVLVELPDATQRRGLDEMLRADPLPGVLEHVPAARTVLVRVAAGHSLGEIARALRGLDVAGFAVGENETDDPVELEVRYDGPDLAEVADQLGIDPAEVVRRHTGQVWTVDFAGFSPGFGYLTGEHADLTVSRRENPRTKIPAGSVALAGEYTGVYPQPSPGGWQLIGTTSATLWDPAAEPPALLAPGVRIRFVDLDRSAAGEETS